MANTQYWNITRFKTKVHGNRSAQINSTFYYEENKIEMFSMHFNKIKKR
jgi:hypothetical protein